MKHTFLLISGSFQPCWGQVLYVEHIKIIRTKHQVLEKNKINEAMKHTLYFLTTLYIISISSILIMYSLGAMHLFLILYSLLSSI